MNRKALLLLRNSWDRIGMLGMFLVLFAVLSLTVDNFFTFRNMIGLTLSVSMVGMVACTMLFCLASGDFDLSIGSVVACAGVVTVLVINETGSITLGISAGILTGGAVGLINGVIIAKFRINALITTLATMQIVRGLGYILSGGVAIGVRDDVFPTLGTGWTLWVPNPVWITAILFAVFGWLLRSTTFGRNTLAIGGNREAARLAGIAVDRIKITIFALQGLVAGAAGVVLASRLHSGQPAESQGFALDVIAACVLGGVALTGGVGTMTGTIVGVLIMGTAQNALNMLNVPTFSQYVVRGTILLLAVLLDRLKRVRTAG